MSWKSEPPETKEILLFALLCVLESMSYTRKDGQYLRWDYRSGRRNGKNPFDKGKILSFNEAIVEKLNEIKDDINLGDGNRRSTLIYAGGYTDRGCEFIKRVVFRGASSHWKAGPILE